MALQQKAGKAIEALQSDPLVSGLVDWSKVKRLVLMSPPAAQECADKARATWLQASISTMRRKEGIYRHEI